MEKEKSPPSESRVGSSGIAVKRLPTVTSSEAADGAPSRAYFQPSTLEVEATTPRHTVSVQN